MNILILNGSPRKSLSNTMKITNAFIDGLESKISADIETVEIYKNDVIVNHCTGCYSCWTKTPGKCIFKDTMAEILNKMLQADIIIWSFPIYYFGLPSKAKACMDRTLPLNEPFMQSESAGHTQRYDLSHQKQIVISSGGLSTVENNFEALEKQFELISENHHGNYTMIFSTQSPLLSVDGLKETTDKFLNSVKDAGIEYAEDFSLSKETFDAIKSPMFPISVYNTLADTSWEIAQSENTDSKTKLLGFTKQMAALYNKDNYTKDIILEIEYPDYDEKYQILLEKDGSCVISDNFKDYTTKIETPYSVWSDISKGNISGSLALMEGKYKVLGDISVMMNWDKLFGTKEINSDKSFSKNKKEAGTQKKTNMNMMLIPWIVMWVSLPFNTYYGSFITILVTLLLPIVFKKLKFTIYDKLSSLFVSLICCSTLVGVLYVEVQPISYILFALLWIGSIFTKIPFSAHYSNAHFGEEKAYENPIFMKTNAILPWCWGILYIMIAAFTIFALRTPLQPYLVIINNIPPILLGIFTKWFQSWYPQKIMSGK